MIDIGGFVLDNETLITVVGVAVFTAMAVSNYIKPALEAGGILKTDKRYPLFVNGLALAAAVIFAIAGLIIFRLGLDSASTVTMALARAFAAAFFATGGYEAYSNITQFVAARKPE